MVSPSQDVRDAADLYVAQFAGRTDAYAYWSGTEWKTATEKVPDAELVEGGPEYRRRSLTGAIALRAFETSIPISTYFCGDDNMTHVAALDIDLPDGFDQGKRVLLTVRRRGGLAYIEKSRRGCHVWIVLTEQRPAIVMRRALKMLALEAGLELDDKGQLDPKIEFRPRQSHIPEGGVGNCLRMPTMPHQKTGVRSILASSDGVKLPGKLTQLIVEFEAAAPTFIDTAAEQAPLDMVAAPPFGLRFPYGDPVGTESASLILQQLWGAMDAQPGKLIHCPAHDDQRPSLSILKDDQRAICRSPSCILHNSEHGRGTWELRELARSHIS